jgi:deoxyribose-phosphate aldolase
MSILEPTLAEVMAMLDHSLLKPTMTEAELEAGCQTAVQLKVASVCLLPYFVERCVHILHGSDVLPTTTIAFPHGALALAGKLRELEVALQSGAKEVDVVVNISQVKSGRFDVVATELGELCQRTHAGGARIKVIFETCYLSDAEKRELCVICGHAGVDWVKTSTGFGAHGATVEDVRLLRENSAPGVQVKASGGIRDLDGVLQYRALGATRVGTSASQAIFNEGKRRLPG